MSEKTKKNLISIGATVISITAFILLWFFGTKGTELGEVMPGPVEVIGDFIGTFTKPIGKYSILGHIGWSLSRVLIGYCLAAVAGITLGILMGWNRYVEAIFKPICEIIRPIPPIAWIPLAILWFGLKENAKYFLIFLAAFNNITINAYQGAKSVNQVLIGASKMLGANKIQTFFTVVLQASIPAIFAGLQVAVSVSWATVVAAEMVRSSEGVGWIIVNAQEMNDMSNVMVGIMAIGIVGYILAVIMRKVEDRLCRWNKGGR